MTDIIQIYKARAVFDKTNYTAANRNIFFKRDETVKSNSGYLSETTVFLPENQKDLIGSGLPGLILLVHRHAVTPNSLVKEEASVKKPCKYICVYDFDTYSHFNNKYQFIICHINIF